MSATGFNKQMNSALSFLDNSAVSNTLRLLFFLYAGMVAPSLPPQASALFGNPLFRLAVLFLIVWIHSKDPTLSLLIAIGLVISFNALSGRNLLEFFRIEQNTNVYPGCLGLTMADILSVFDNDQNALNQALFNSGLPRNIPLNDEFAPLIATTLINHGFDLGEICDLDNPQYFNA